MHDNTAILQLTASIVIAHAQHNAVTSLPDVIRSVYGTLHDLSIGKETAPESAMTQIPAVPIDQSVFPDYIVSLESGRKLKMLKRYLMTSYGMTFEQYRAKWGLPPNYPSVAPNYTDQRSGIAKQFGLGRKAKPDTNTAKAPRTVTAKPAKKAKKKVIKKAKPVIVATDEAVAA